MNTKDIKHLANLSRLQLTDEEVEAYTKQFDEIVAYVDKIKEISVEARHPRVDGDPEIESLDSRHILIHQNRSTPVVHLRGNDSPFNVLREDEVHSYQNPESIIDEAPSHQDNFVKVKKILNQ